MEEIEHKLSSNNPVLISHAISKLLETIKTKVEDGKNKDVSQIPEYKLLLSKYKNNNPLLTVSICQAITFLVENDILNVTLAMSTFISHLSVTNNYAPIAAAISRLLIIDLKQCTASEKFISTYGLQTPQHPFITIINQETHAWQAILHQIQMIMNHFDDQVKENSLEILRPVFLYILCNPSLQFSNECKQQMWKLLLGANNALELQTEILLWLCRNPINVCIDTNHRTVEFLKVCLQQENTNYYSALMPFILSLTIQLLSYGYDPRPNFEIILESIDKCDDLTINIIIALLNEIILECPAVYLCDVLQICIIIVDKKLCNTLLLNALIASILKWMAYPSIMCSNALILAMNLMDKILLKEPNNSIDTKNISKIFILLANSDTNVQFYTEIIHCINSCTDSNMIFWINNISKAPIDLRYKCRAILCGLFLQSTDPTVTKKICDILVQFAKEMNNFASHLLYLILYKLSKSSGSGVLKHLLTAIPELIVAKENVPVIIRILELLVNNDKPLKYFAIELYLKALEKEPRCYRFISTIISRMIKNDSSWYSSVTCARAMMCICETRSEHGEELVPLLSYILNNCTDINGSAASAFALKGISALCKSAVIGICSTWKGLEPMMRKEKRTIVLESLCEFFQYIPHCPYRPSEDHDKLIVDVITTLWTYSICDDVRVAGAALKALMSYRLEQTRLKALPAKFKTNLIIPAAYMANIPKDAAKNPDDILPYIPGVCWIQMLQKINKSLLSAAGDILIQHIKNELGTLRSGIYIWPHGEPNDFKYLPEKSVIRAVGEYLRRNKPDRENERIITECLRIFAYKYPKPLPNVKWIFLQNTIEMSDVARRYSLSIACCHATISLSARTFVEEYLLTYDSNPDPMLQSKEYLAVYSNLDSLCQTLQPQYLKSFLNVTLDHVLEKMRTENEETTKLFEDIMNAYASTLKNDAIHDGNRTILFITIEQLLDKIDLTGKRFLPYIKAVSCLSSKEIERMVLPSVWWDVTTKKLQNAITIRTELAMEDNTEILSLWMNDAIDIALSNPGVQTYFLERMQKVYSNMRFEKSSVDWTLSFIQRIQHIVAELSESSSEEEYNKLTFYCDILFVSIISLSALDCLLLRKETIIISQDIRTRLFPQAIAILSDRKFWKDVIPQLMDWLDYMRTSPLPESCKTAFYISLVSLRHESHYQKMWTKYLSQKTSVIYEM